MNRGRAVQWGLIGQVIGLLAAMLHLSGPGTLIVATTATVITALVGS